MGAGYTQVSSYRMKRGFYQAKDKCPKSGTPLWFVIEPFHSCEGERFFYVKKLENGKYHFKGEMHTLYRPEHLTEYLKELRKELEGVPIHYFFIDDNGVVVKKEVAKEPVRGIKPSNSNLTQ